MEHSSPLAAMQPPSMLFGRCFRSDVPTSFPTFGARKLFEANSFNFRDLSMRRPQQDYFSAKPIHGSSPAASLAADLSQNFHIDQSPQLATPRRSLFSANLLAAERRFEECITTPPLPSSSPAATMEMMDMSPLPHKLPFALTTDIALDSPTPETSSANSTMTPMTSPLDESPIESGPLSVLEERKRQPPLLRPSFIRTKTYSTQMGTTRPSGESRGPLLKFGNGGSQLSHSVSMSLGDLFEQSPNQDKSMGRASLPPAVPPPRLRPPFAAIVSNGRSGASPASGAIRKTSNPFMRPRKQCRRSLSMFEHPDEIVRQSEPAYSSNVQLQSIMDIEPAHTLQLPHFTPEGQPDSLPRIEKSTLVEILDGKYNDRFENIMIIDCRFEYEYSGGHINGAVNYNDKELFAKELFSDLKPGSMLIFHCEYSAHRAPIMASYIRHQDRAYNIDHYPKLTFPEMYILDGGYRDFFAEHRSLCIPQNYVEMSSKEHEFACERGLGKVKQRSKFMRAQTFAFGQQSPQMEDSPTGRCRNTDRGRSLDSPFGSEISDTGRIVGRRMISY